MKDASGLAPDPGDVGRLPAPTDLELVRALINSRNSSSTWDKLATAAAAEAWLRERGLIGAKIRLSAAEAAQLRAMREALRGLAARSSGLDLPTDVALLQRAAERAKFGLGFDLRTGRSELRPTAGGVAGAVGRILGEVHEAMHDGTWERLKICAADTCVWAFYDRSKNSHSRWCSPAVCGNRDKVRRYRERARKSVGKRR